MWSLYLVDCSMKVYGPKKATRKPIQYIWQEFILSLLMQPKVCKVSKILQNSGTSVLWEWFNWVWSFLPHDQKLCRNKCFSQINPNNVMFHNNRPQFPHNTKWGLLPNQEGGCREKNHNGKNPGAQGQSCQREKTIWRHISWLMIM